MKIIFYNVNSKKSGSVTSIACSWYCTKNVTVHCVIVRVNLSPFFDNYKHSNSLFGDWYHENAVSVAEIKFRLLK